MTALGQNVKFRITFVDRIDSYGKSHYYTLYRPERHLSGGIAPSRHPSSTGISLVSESLGKAEDVAIVREVFCGMSKEKILLDSPPLIGSFAGTQYLTGLRCYAALAVFFIHSGGLGLRTSPIAPAFFNRVVDFGKYGVVVFFVLSAVTIAMSIDNSPKFNYLTYLAKRFLRIAPLYYLVLAAAFFFGGNADYFKIFSVENDLKNLLMHFSFLNLFDAKYRNNLIGVEWTIPLEMFYYFVLPVGHFVFMKYKNISGHLLIMSLSFTLVCSVLFMRFYDPQFWVYASHWSIEKYLFCYVVGLLIYENFLKSGISSIKLNSWYIIEMVILLVCFIRSDLKHEEEFIALWTAGLILILNSRSRLGVLLFENKPALYLGKISYSLYLVHFPILLLVRNYVSDPISIFFVGLAVTVLVSSITYYLIEEPFMRVGKLLLVRSKT